VAGRIYVLAGTNGAGKSSVGGEVIRAAGTTYFNPDEVTRKIHAANPHLTEDACNSRAWKLGADLLRRAIDEHGDFAFETTLGGNTITAMLLEALDKGLEVHMWYASLASPELHIARVAARVAAGGHHIPEKKIRERYAASRRNLVRLIPKLTTLSVFDNSTEAAPENGAKPELFLVLRTAVGKTIGGCPAAQVPEWAKSLVAAAMRSKLRIIT
jgi:predicted ABC-type ATPase